MKQLVGLAVRTLALAVVLVLAASAQVAVRAAATSPDAPLELVAQIQGQAGTTIRWIEALEGLDRHPGEIVLAVMNTSSPETIWKAVLDPGTGNLVSVTQKQTLDQLELVRYRLFESSDGTLFTASGISGYRPAYFSTDAGESWRTADAGAVYPPNTTFSYVEFRGSVYVGTGYEPYPGEIYRWLGEGRWELIWQSPWPTRNMVNDMTVFHDRLFISTPHYAAGSPVPGTPSALVSDDGINFVPTQGLPPDLKQLLRFFVVGDELLAAGSMEIPGQDRMFHWLEAEARWEQIADYAGRWTWRPHVAALAYGDSLYAYGQVTGDESGGLYRSQDLGVTWVQVAPMPGRAAWSLAAYYGDLYLGTNADSDGVAYLYRYRPHDEGTPVVNSTADPGDGTCNATECTLREAIVAANAHGPGTTITFNIPGEGPHTIRPQTQLPDLAGGIVLDGFSQPGARPNTNALADGINAVLKIELDGSAAGAGGYGLVAYGATVKGLVVNRFGAGGVVVVPSGELPGAVQGCFVGTDVTGMSALANGQGIFVGERSLVGGDTPADRMLISGNRGPAVTGSLIDLRGAYVGTDASGLRPLGNATGIESAMGGVRIVDSVISANGHGVRALIGSSVDMQRTYVGLDARGEGNLGNAGYGVVISEGKLTIESSRIAYNNKGVGISWGVPGLITNTVISDQRGPGLAMGQVAQVTVENSVLARNAGGAIAADFLPEAGYPYTVRMVNTTISADTLADPGRGLVVAGRGQVSLINTTVYAKVQNTGALTVENTILAGGCRAAAGDLPLTSRGHNLAGDTSCNLTGPGDITGDLLLGPLQDNGGPTWTHALLACSPALDAGDNAACPATDQRGLSRPKDGNGDGTALCDIGAFEAQQPLICTPPTRFATIAIVKDAQPDANRNFLFYGAYGAFKLDDPGFDDADKIGRSITYNQVLPGVHTFSDALPFRWYLHEVICEPALGSTATCAIDLVQRTVAITAKAGDVITATFTNQQKGSLLVRAYWDKNGDGIRQGRDPLQSGWWTELYDLTIGQGPGSVTASNFTNTNGKWNVVDLIPSHQYGVCQKPQRGWTNTQPGSTFFDDRSWPCYTFTLQPAQAAEVWFGYATTDVAAQTIPARGTAATGLLILDNYLDPEQDAMYDKEDYVDQDMLTPIPTDPDEEPVTPIRLFLPAVSNR